MNLAGRIINPVNVIMSGLQILDSKHLTFEKISCRGWHQVTKVVIGQGSIEMDSSKVRVIEDVSRIHPRQFNFESFR